MKRCFFSCLLALVIFHGASAIKCWVCRSDLDPRCVDPFDNTTLPIYDCAVESLEHLPGVKASMCRKIRQKVYGNWRFIRSCAFLGSPGEGTGNENFCTMRTGTYNVFVETCTCDSKDGCNAASTLSPSAWYYSLLLFLACSLIAFLALDARLLL